MTEYSAFTHNDPSTIYPYREPISSDFRVRIQGQEIPVYTCRISRYPFNRVYPGFERPISQTVRASYINLVGEGETELEILPVFEFETARVKPYSRGVNCVKNAGTLRVTLKENGRYVLQCDSHWHSLFVFYSKPIPAPVPESVTHYFGPGIHFVEKIELKSNESVYVDKDALVLGRIFAENAENIRVFGNGVLDDRRENRVDDHCYEKTNGGNMKFYRCKGITIEGVAMKDATNYCVSFFGCSQIRMNDAKIFGQWRYNNDGIDLCNCQDVQIRNCFVQSFDDTIAVKGLESNFNLDCTDILVEGCELWCDWGKACELGVESVCRNFRNITFRNCDILRSGHTAVDITTGDVAECYDLLFEDLRLEYNGFDTPEQLQETDESVYTRQNEPYVPRVVLVRNYPWRTPEAIKDWGLLPIPQGLDLTGVQSRCIHDVMIRNIQIFYDPQLPTENGKPLVLGYVGSDLDAPAYYNITLENISVNGVRIAPEDMKIEFDHTENGQLL